LFESVFFVVFVFVLVCFSVCLLLLFLFCCLFVSFVLFSLFCCVFCVVERMCCLLAPKQRSRKKGDGRWAMTGDEFQMTLRAIKRGRDIGYRMGRGYGRWRRETRHEDPWLTDNTSSHDSSSAGRAPPRSQESMTTSRNTPLRNLVLLRRLSFHTPWGTFRSNPMGSHKKTYGVKKWGRPRGGRFSLAGRKSTSNRSVTVEEKQFRDRRRFGADSPVRYPALANARCSAELGSGQPIGTAPSVPQEGGSHRSPAPRSTGN